MSAGRLLYASQPLPAALPSAATLCLPPGWLGGTLLSLSRSVSPRIHTMLAPEPCHTVPGPQEVKGSV